MADELFLTPAEVALELRCSTATILRAIASGRLEAVEVGERTVRIPAGEYRRFTGKGRKDGDAAPPAAGSSENLARTA